MFRRESSALPTNSASGSLVAGVDGGGQVVDLASSGVSFVFESAMLTDLEVFGVSLAFGPIDMFSFSASQFFTLSTVGAPSMNWKALSFVRVCDDGMMGGPVRGGGASGLLWWGYGGPLRGRFHWPLKC
jgi:hypothetical protein